MPYRLRSDGRCGQGLTDDCRVEEGQVPCLIRKLEPYTDGPDISDPERGCLPN